MEWHLLDFEHLNILASEVSTEVVRATEKHKTEAMTSANLNVGKRLGILGEEFGEVCRATTYDNGSVENLREELVQTAAMALAWVYAIDKDSSVQNKLKQLRQSIEKKIFPEQS